MDKTLNSFEITLINEFEAKLSHLASFFDDRYKPLQSRFKIKNDDPLYIEIQFGLIGQNRWRIVTAQKLEKNSFGYDKRSLKVDLVVKNIQQSLEDKVMKEGITAINNRR